MLQNFILTRHFSTVLALERSRPSTPRITHRARANWLVSPPILSSGLGQAKAPSTCNQASAVSSKRGKLVTKTIGETWAMGCIYKEENNHVLIFVFHLGIICNIFIITVSTLTRKQIKNVNKSSQPLIYQLIQNNRM